MRLVLAAALSALALAAPAVAGELAVAREDQLSPRLREYGFTTPALSEETNVRVLLPDGYDADRSRRYPVLYRHRTAAASLGPPPAGTAACR